MDALASAEQRSAIERAHGALRDAVTSVHNLNQLLRSLRVGPQAVAEAIGDMNTTCTRTVVIASRDFLHTAESCLGLGSTGVLEAIISERCRELELGLGDPSPLNAARRLQLEHVTARFIQDLDATLVLVELLREVTTAPRTPIDLCDLVQRLPTDAAISAPSRRIKASVSLDKGGIEITSNPRALLLLLLLNAAFVTLDGDGCHLTLSRGAGAQPRVVFEPRAQSNDTIELLVPRLLKASKVCAQSAARALGTELNWVKDPRAAELHWIT